MLAYLGDILVFSKTIKHYEEDLKEVCKDDCME